MKKFLFVLLILVSFVSTAYAISIGTISSTNKYAKILSGPYAGTQIDFRPNDTASVQGIEVRNDRIRGYAWGEATGWIVFSCEDTVSGCVSANGNFKVENNGLGGLRGYAWGEATGWISFSCYNPTTSCTGPAGSWGVDIIGGLFTGYAWSQNFGWIRFDCNVSGACVTTDWTSPYGGTTGGTSSGGSGGASGTTGGGTTTGGDTGTTTGGDTGTTTGGDSTTGGDTGTTTGGDTGTTTGGDTTGGDTGTTTGGDTTGGDSTTGGTSGTSSGGSGSSSSGGGGIFGSIIVNTANGNITFGETIAQSFTVINKSVVKNVKKAAEKISDPEFIAAVGETSSKAIPVAGAAAGLMATLTSLLFTQAVSFSEIIFLPLRLWSSFLLLFGITRKPWGTVYDSLTKQPIDPAYVSLIDVATGEEVVSSLTDINGRYGFDNIKAGKYKIVASKTHYKFPTVYLANQPSDEIYEDVYHGEEFEIFTDGALITKNIPIDAESVDWNEVAKREQNLMTFNPIHENRWQKIAHFIFIAGFLSAMLFILTNPNLINKISLGYYVLSGIIMYVMRIPKIRAMFSKSHGLVVESKNEAPVPFAMIEVKNPETGVVVTKRVTNQDGLFYALLEKGTYKVDISKQEKVGAYTKVFESNPIEVNKGFISSKFEI